MPLPGNTRIANRLRWSSRSKQDISDVFRAERADNDEIGLQALKLGIVIDDQFAEDLICLDIPGQYSEG
jgi:hypothetical protein